MNAVAKAKAALDEVTAVLRTVEADNLAGLGKAIAKANRIFVTGAGRTRLILSCFAMRLVQLGVETHVVGEATAPAIGPGDLLVVASGSGTTPSVLLSTQQGGAAGAKVVVVTAKPGSALAARADLVVSLGAQTKLDRDVGGAAQLAGSAFEQALLFVLDGLALDMATRYGVKAGQPLTRHANLE